MAKSKAQQHKLTHPTLDWDHNAGELKQTADYKQYNLSHADARPKGKQFGMRITVDAFHQLLKGALRVNGTQKKPSVRYVEFSKASILRVLSQPGCEFIRFYFVYPEKNKMSLVLEGLDTNQRALKFESHVMRMAAPGKVRAADDDDPDYEERGNGEESGEGGDGGGGEPFAAVAPASGKDASKKNAAAVEQASLASLLKAINTRGGE